ncbi:unnamed protein product [Thelazia callipaeda]|uniref:Secreted protein n=1 Tax=Thelazia callipaeda TaxID=103827 RepID=A0A0N5CTS7_THECL|nr:unnamed protein product [Thelazia callipaeda]
MLFCRSFNLYAILALCFFFHIGERSAAYTCSGEPSGGEYASHNATKSMTDIARQLQAAQQWYEAMMRQEKKQSGVR